jgi:predicted enzyme related to lactoylglutathione lyase
MTTIASPIRVLEFAFTGYPVTDLARARAFYEGLLNLKTGMVWEEGTGRAWIEYDVGGHTLAINNTSPEWKPSNDGPAIALEVEDFDAAVAKLKEHGVKFVLEPFQSPVCRLAVILDPDGNSLAIHKRNAQLRG